MILSLDTSTLTLSLAIRAPDGAVLEERRVPPPQRQSRALPLAIDELLGAHRASLKDLRGLVVGLGPGSFTGLRIGVSTVKGLAYALRIPVAGVSSLAALAMEGPVDVELWSCAMVKRGEVYIGRYRRTPGGLEALAPVFSCTVTELAASLCGSKDARLLGPATVETRESLLNQGVQPEQILEGPLVPSGGALLALAQMPSQYQQDALFALEPHYVRGSGAEENPKFPPLPGVAPVARLKQD